MDGDAQLLELFRGIAERDSSLVSQLLAANPDLLTAGSQLAEEFLPEIRHQFYVGDTALHIAAAAFWPDSDRPAACRWRLHKSSQPTRRATAALRRRWYPGLTPVGSRLSG